MLGRVIPVERPRDADLFVKLASPDHRHGDFNPVIERCRDPRVVSAARGPRHPDSLRVYFFPGHQIPERALRFVLGEALLRHADQQSLDAPVVT